MEEFFTMLFDGLTMTGIATAPHVGKNDGDGDVVVLVCAVTMVGWLIVVVLYISCGFDCLQSKFFLCFKDVICPMEVNIGEKRSIVFGSKIDIHDLCDGASFVRSFVASNSCDIGAVGSSNMLSEDL